MAMSDLHSGLCTHHVPLFPWQLWEIETVILPDFLDWKIIFLKKTRLKVTYLVGPKAGALPRSPSLSVTDLPSDLSTESELDCSLQTPQSCANFRPTSPQSISPLAPCLPWETPQKTAFLRGLVGEEATSHVSSPGTREESDIRRVPGTRERGALSETWGRARVGV